MTYSIDMAMVVAAVIALIVGLMIGLALRAPLKRKSAVLQERNDGLSRERDTAHAERDRLAIELKAREAQIRPLADEVDKLRRDFARARGNSEVAATPAEARNIDPRDLHQL